MHVEQAEINLLNSAIQNPEITELMVTELDSKHFQTKEYRKIFEALKHLLKENKTIGIHELLAYKDKFGFNPQIAIGLLSTAEYSESLCQDFIDVIKYHHYRSKFADYASSLQRNDEMTFPELQTHVENIIDEISEQKKTHKTQTFQEYLNNFQDGMNFCEYIDDQKRRWLEDDNPPGFLTGYKKLDEMLTYIPRQGYVVIGASTSTGKTTFSLSLLKSIVQKNPKFKCAFFSFEETPQGITEKLACMLACIDRKKLTAEIHGKPSLTDEEKLRVRNILESENKFDLIIEGGFSPYVENVCTKIKKLSRMHGTRVFVIDYLTKLKSREKFANNHLAVDHISKKLQYLAQEENVCIIVLAQLNREAVKDVKFKPKLSSFRESGSIEEDCDVAIILNRPEKQDPNDRPGITVVHVMKNRRFGDTGDIEFIFEGGSLRERDYTQISDDIRRINEKIDQRPPEEYFNL